MKIRMLRSLRHGGDWLRCGTVVEARRMPGLTSTPAYQVTEDGQFSGVMVPFDCCIALPDERTYTEAEYTAVNQELLQRREEVAHLMQEKRRIIDEYEKRFLIMEDAQERREREWERKLAEAREAKKVPLPREVADAIDSVRKTFGCSNFNLVDSVNQALRGAKTDKYTSVIANWVAGDFVRGEILVKALVNGHTVEETREDMINRRIREIVDEHRNRPALTSIEESNATLADEIAAFVRSVYAEKD